MHAEGVAFFEYALAATLDKVVESVGESCHAIAQVVEAEVDRREAICHR